jgi:hypothetical protein
MNTHAMKVFDGVCHDLSELKNENLSVRSAQFLTFLPTKYTKLYEKEQQMVFSFVPFRVFRGQTVFQYGGLCQ